MGGFRGGHSQLSVCGAAGARRCIGGIRAAHALLFGPARRRGGAGDLFQSVLRREPLCIGSYKSVPSDDLVQCAESFPGELNWVLSGLEDWVVRWW